MSSILDLSSCAYAKGISYKLFSSNVGLTRDVGEPQVKFTSRVRSQRLTIYNESFKNCGKYGIPYKIFVDKFPKIKERLNLWGKRYSNEKKIFLTKYNISEWSNVNYEDKSKHALFECPECMADKHLMELCKTFPIKTNAGKRKLKGNGWRENKQDNENEKVDFFKNGGQIIKKVLEDNNIDMTKFDYLGKNNSCRLQRKKIRLSDDILCLANQLIPK